MHTQQNFDKMLLKKATHKRLMDFSDSELRRVFHKPEELERFKQIIRSNRARN